MGNKFNSTLFLVFFGLIATSFLFSLATYFGFLPQAVLPDVVQVTAVSPQQIFRSCSTLAGHSECSKNQQPLFCYDGTFVKRADLCGCSEDYRVNGRECVKILKCTDGTEYAACSTTKPKYCDDGQLVDKANACGCVSGLIAGDDDTCLTKEKYLAYLRKYALELINEDRAKNGVAPVGLGNNAAAQLHAEDMLANKFISHWGTNGLKPYVRYTKSGGQGAVFENTAFSGFFYNEPLAKPVEPKNAIALLEYGMMYDDASSDWGHKDNVLGKNHNKVNIGIAFDDASIALVQDFEDDYISWINPLTYTNGVLSMSGKTILGKISGISVYYDSLPTQLTSEQLLSPPYDSSYGLGEAAGVILQPGYLSNELNYVTADQWQADSSGSFSINANIRPLLNKGAGVYTIVVWAEKNAAHVPLTTYSIFA